MLIVRGGFEDTQTALCSSICVSNIHAPVALMVSGVFLFFRNIRKHISFLSYRILLGVRGDTLDNIQSYRNVSRHGYLSLFRNNRSSFYLHSCRGGLW